jgi:hypothetical protein
MERVLRDEEREEREARALADALEGELDSAPTTPPTEEQGEAGLADALPGQIANGEGAGRVEEYQSDEDEVAGPLRPGALLELDDGTVALGARRR